MMRVRKMMQLMRALRNDVYLQGDALLEAVVIVQPILERLAAKVRD